jgi:hypothetical protein
MGMQEAGGNLGAASEKINEVYEHLLAGNQAFLNVGENIALLQLALKYDVAALIPESADRLRSKAYVYRRI